MKTLSLLILAFSLNAFAEVPSYTAKEVTCAELQEAVASYKVISVKYGLFGISYKPVYSDNSLSTCDSSFYWPWPQAAYFTTKDVKNCKAGYTCEKR